MDNLHEGAAGSRGRRVKAIKKDMGAASGSTRILRSQSAKNRSDAGKKDAEE